MITGFYGTLFCYSDLSKLGKKNGWKAVEQLDDLNLLLEGDKSEITKNSPEK